MDFDAFKKMQDSLNEKIAETDKQATGFKKDERFWELTQDVNKTGKATIRFLPQKDPSKAPIIKLFRHGAPKIDNRYLSCECPFTKGEECPVCNHSAAIWKINEPLARGLWRKKTFLANILVVDDPAVPENNGKVFMYKFGQQIFDLIKKATQNPEVDERMQIFSFDAGHNFKLELIQDGGYNNYDKNSMFSLKQTAIGNGEIDKQREIFNSLYDLSDYAENIEYLSTEKLESKLNYYLNGKASGGSLEEKLKKENAEKEKPVDELPLSGSSNSQTPLPTSGKDEFEFGDLSVGPDDDIPF